MPGLLRCLTAVAILALAEGSAAAQNPPPPPPVRVALPPVVVTAQKEPADAADVPSSVTVVRDETLAQSGVRIVSDAALFAPNTFFTEFTARKASNPRFRGIGASPANPAVTTYIDGVPQLNANSSSIELLDVSQIEFVRGPQSPLYGRNALGGVINVTTARPSLSGWTGSVIAPFGNAAAREVRAGISGPLGGTVGIGVSVGRQRRDGFSRNDLTGRDIDFRDGSFGKAQLMWVPRPNWEARVLVSAERNRDGDYTLTDLAEARTRAFRVQRDFEGFQHRDVRATTVILRGESGRATFTSSTGFVRWRTEDATDLDYSPLPLATRHNAERSRQFTQELRFASPQNTPLRLGDGLRLRWQGGVMLFTQVYDQRAVNRLAPFTLSPFITFPVDQISPEADLDDFGLGVFGQATLVVRDRLDLTVGGRFDRERKQAVLDSYLEPAVAPAVRAAGDRRYRNVSPQVALGYRLAPAVTAYGSISQGFKAGGWNPASPAGREAYAQEEAWHAEAGLKGSAAGGRLTASAAVFRIAWDDLQLNVPNPQVPGQFFISNVGGAVSRGVEVELNARPVAAVELFGNVGLTRAQFTGGTSALGADVSGNRVPNTPAYTGAVGIHLTRAVASGRSLFARGEAVFYGDMQYDERNTAGQDAYSLVNLRGGFRGRLLFIESWVRNAFDTRYVPVAFPYPFAPSGFVGEFGRPRTFGLSAGVQF